MIPELVGTENQRVLLLFAVTMMSLFSCHAH